MVRSLPPTLRAGTRDLPAVPRWLQAWVVVWCAAILAWAETRMYRLVLTQCRDQPLVQPGQACDLTAVVAACAAFRADPDGPGTAATFTVEQLVRAEIVRAWAAPCSERDLEWHLNSNLVVRWFVGLSLFAPRVPDHTPLQRFHTWMRDHAPAAWFADVLSFL
ncbi:transposase [Roseiflexus sp.]|uniref:transposase n=1 Tax=Roseiflexus sp. TaxID=2562120 RepID=UPI00398B74DC